MQWSLWAMAGLSLGLSAAPAQEAGAAIVQEQGGTRQKSIALVKQAEAAFYRSDYATTQRLCRQTIKTDPSYSRAYVWLGAAQQKQNQREPALQAFLQVVGLYPKRRTIPPRDYQQDLEYARKKLEELGYPRFYLNEKQLPVSLLIADGKLQYLLPASEAFKPFSETEDDRKTGTTRVRCGEKVLEFRVGSAKIRFNDQEERLSIAPQVRAGRLVVPLRLLQVLGGEVAWDAQRRTINVVTPPCTPKDQNTAGDPTPPTDPTAPIDPPTPDTTPAPTPLATPLSCDFAPQELPAGDGNSIDALAFSPDSSLLASGSWKKDPKWGLGGQIKLWDVRSGKLRRTLAGHGATIKAFAFAPDGKTLVSAGWDQTLIVWDVAAGKPYRLPKAHSAMIVALDFSPDGQKFVSAGTDGQIILWDKRTRQPQRELPSVGQSGKVRAFTFRWDGSSVALIAAGGDDEKVRLWDVHSKLWRTLMDYQGRVTALGFAPDGKTLISASGNRGNRVWRADVAGATLVNALWKQDSQINALAFSSDGATLVTGSDDGALSLWNMGQSKQMCVQPAHKSTVRALAIAPDGTSFASAAADGTLLLWQPGAVEKPKVVEAAAKP